MKTKLILIAIIAMFGFKLNAQSCGTCTINITGYDTLAYTVNVGQTICIDTTGNFQGKITLNGGTVCNKGLCLPSQFNFNSGTFSNYGNATILEAVTLGANKTVHNQLGATLNLGSTLILNGGSLTNNGITNVGSSFTNSSGSVTNTGILNCTSLNGNNTINNSGVINSN